MPATTFSVSHLAHVLKAYSPIIALSMLAIMTAYVTVAIMLYLRAPSQHVTSLPFRLEFEGVDRGEYPNGTRFSGAEIVGTPLLVKVFEQNHLSRFVPFTDFSRSIFVFEANAAKDALDREYQSRLSDPKLSPIDRERIQREYEAKLDSVSKSQYSINYMHKEGSGGLPPGVAAKALSDILSQWTEFVSKEQRVLEYRVPTLSPDVIAGGPTINNPVIAAQVLRAKVMRLLENIDQLRHLPSAELARTSADNLTLQDIRLRVDDLLRFRLEPLIHSAAVTSPDRAATIRFLETQLAFDQRILDAQKQVAEAAQKTAAMYSNPRPGDSAIASAATGEPARAEEQKETVMPQVGDTFLQSLVQLTTNAADANYRRQLAERYRDATVKLVPLQQAVAYDTFVLQLVRSGSSGGGTSADVAEQQLSVMRAEVRDFVVKTHEIYGILSRNMNPSTQLITVFTPSTNIERSLTLERLALIAILVFLLSLPAVIFLCLLHHRIRREEAEEGYVEGGVETPADTSAWPQPASTIDNR